MTIELKVSTAMVMAMVTAMAMAMVPTVMGTMKTVNKKRSLVK